MRNAIISCLCGILGVNATVSHNKMQNGIEVRFAVKPEDAEINFLKSNGFRWSMCNHVWYAKYHESMFKKLEMHFSTPGYAAAPSSQPISTSEPTPQEPKSKAETAINNFLALYDKDPDLRERFNIARNGFEEFLMHTPATVVLRNMTVSYDRSKGQFSHLPEKRKRPDYYDIYTVYDMIMNEVTKLGANPGLLEHVKLKIKTHSLDSKSSFDRFIGERPQYFIDRDYYTIQQFFIDIDNWHDDEESRWEEWSDQNIKEGITVYVKSGSEWYDNSLYKTSHRHSSLNMVQSTVEIRSKYGYITHISQARIENVYDKPNGTSLKDLYPDARPNKFGSRPELNDYISGKVKPNQKTTLLKLKMKAKALKLKLQLNQHE